jgi:hypothetical protein
MKIIKQISPRGCANGACPSLLVTDTDVVLVQGLRLAKEGKHGLVIPDHEDVVAIPKVVFGELLDQYRP